MVDHITQKEDISMRSKLKHISRLISVTAALALMSLGIMPEKLSDFFGVTSSAEEIAITFRMIFSESL